ncbi:hypothetical protein GCM10020000_21100 [Streptomyces olivoverticillatus]
MAAASGERLQEGVPALARGRQDPVGRGDAQRLAASGEDSGPDVVQVLISGEFGLERPQALVVVAVLGRLEGLGADELGEGGEAGGVVDPVDDHPLLLYGGHARGEREAEREQDAGHEDDEQGGSSRVRTVSYGPYTGTTIL